MWIADQWKDYALLDTSGGARLERWGNYILVRPDPQAIWQSAKRHEGWKAPNAVYHRSGSGGGHWEIRSLPESWKISYRDLTFQVKPMNFKHTGIFPEQAVNWDFMREQIRKAGRPVKVLNLFAYTGGATMACAREGASVVHVDASKGMARKKYKKADPSALQDHRFAAFFQNFSSQRRDHRFTFSKLDLELCAWQIANARASAASSGFGIRSRPRSWRVISIT